jgi:hypothetical protein
VYVRHRTDAGETRRHYGCTTKEMTMHDPTVATAWQRFLDKVKGFWRKPVEHNVAATTRALNERENNAQGAAESPAVSQR